jgi:hypothetical protein
MVAYGQRLKKDPDWALEEGGKFFSGKSDVNAALLRITKRLDELAISYAVVGGMALFQYGYRRFTEDVDLLVTSEGLRAIHSTLEGRGYLPMFAGSRNLRDTESGVSIEFLVAGEYPGDGIEKPIKFPEPDGATTFVGGIRCLNLAALIELKLASGITSPGRLKDLADVQQLIQVLRLPSSYADQLDEYVKAKFKELVGTDTPARRFIRLWPGDVQHENLETDLQVMLADGVALEVSPDPNEPSWLVTQDPTIAQKYDMHDEIEFMK